MAVSGKNFFSSAWNGFLLNLKHGIVFVWANFLAKLFIALGKVGITVLNVYTCYLLMKMRGDLVEPGMNPKVPLIFVAFSLTSFKIFSLECLMKELLLCLPVFVVIQTSMKVYKVLDQVLSITNLIRLRLPLLLLRKLMMLRKKEQPFSEEINKNT